MSTNNINEEDEPDDSHDKDWSEEESLAQEEEEEVVDAEGTESSVDEDVDLRINLIEVDLQKVSELIQTDACKRRYLEGKAREIEWLLCSFVPNGTLRPRRPRKLHYFLPFVGQVCRPLFARCLGVAPLTVQRYKIRVWDGNISAKKFAEEVGEVVPVWVRLQKTVDDANVCRAVANAWRSNSGRDRANRPSHRISALNVEGIQS
ncbi:hypothetical protein PC128_g20098 [Phytophthora cactorum]|uniref:Uncharacterized protein n=1 Tax=Phytophthora cactorum TaxID=29920 RepID=A0A8T1BUA6_9STRA|nr:hypothetical protein PC117_g19873 [Phytophthora cactorum]KAG3164612.1 hypothetical protein PC128_g20098 [Phytophthora cactorum]